MSSAFLQRVAGITHQGDVTEFVVVVTIGTVLEFAAAVAENGSAYATGHDARRALAVALACIESVQNHAPVRIGGGQVVAG